jgi:hypothetical protein
VGIVMHDLDVGREDASARIRSHSFAESGRSTKSSRKLREIADEIVKNAWRRGD